MPRVERLPSYLRIALIYVLVSAAWIYLSDQFLDRFQTVKGWLFVLGSALLIYVLVRREVLGRQHSEERFRTLVEQSLVGVYLIQQGRFTYASPRLAEIFGFSVAELLALDSVLALVLPEDRPLVEENLRRRVEGEVEALRYGFRGLRKDGSLLHVEVYGRRLAFAGEPVVLGVLLDVTERKLTQERYLQAQKLEAVARLAGGVAHDFNNVLSVITGATDLLLRDAPGAGPIRADLEEIKGAAERGAALVRQLLAFSRRQPGEPTVLDLNAVITELEPILRRLLGNRMEVVLDLERSLHPATADRSQVEQVIMNLAVNARDAMPDGGRLTIQTASVSDPPDSKASEAAWVMIAVSDTGHGIPEAIRERIFEPFFTTKDPDKGTGLGLSTVSDIVKRAGGAIRLESTLGAGTTFRIYLPVLGEERRQAKA
ncbi:MAG: PAS domain S-box protein [Gemmatimonadetes bacterium]|nr:PAS domain S-box protein [Gemmatimonadota bacterium]